MSYHIGLGKHNKTLIVYACKDIDYMDCEVYDYLGEREITKTKLKKDKPAILEYAKKINPKVYGGLKFIRIE